MKTQYCKVGTIRPSANKISNTIAPRFRANNNAEKKMRYFSKLAK